jgi:hypothetical protein
MHRPENKFEKYLKYLLIFLSVVFIVLFIFLTRAVIHLKRAEIINAREIQFSTFLKSHGPLTVSDVGVVAPWMTFGYINDLFAVPSTYLETALNISSSKYPQISLSGYARSNKINTATFVSEVQTALSNYLNEEKP